jgi:hypothetical protein
VQLAERLEHLDPVAADLLVQASMREGIGEPDAPDPVSGPDRGVGVDDAEVRVDAKP